MKLSLSMICKGELDNLQKLLPEVIDHIDEWVIVFPPGDDAIEWAEENGIKVVVKDFTQEIEPEIIEEFKRYNLDVDADYRLFNFANARNESLKHCTGDYVLWLDGDDEPVGLGELRKILDKTSKPEVLDVLYEYGTDSEGNQIANQIRERIVVNNGKFTWKGAKLGLIHETLVPDEGYVPLTLTVEPEVFKVVHHTDHEDESSARNHIALLYEYIKTDAEDARTIYYLGVEFFNRKMYEQAIGIMQEYVTVGGWDEERYRAYITMAESYHQINDKKSSRNAYLAAIKELPHYPDAYLGLGESYYSDEDWGKAVEFIKTGLQKEIPKTKSAVNMVKYTFRAMTFLALAYSQLGLQSEAYTWFSSAKRANPEHPWVKEYEPLFEEIKDLDEYIRSFVALGQITKKRYPKVLSKMVDIIPSELKDQELLLAFKRQFTIPKVWDDKTITIFCSQAFEEWGPDSLKTGTGGSEEAVINLSKRWAEMGYKVTVFNNCPEEKTVDGVEWKRYEDFNPRDVFNILIAWRNNPFLESKVANKKFIDVHDVPSLRYFTKESLEDVKLMVKSDYHRTLFPHLEDDNFVVIPNGYNPEQFTEEVKIKNNLVWTSSYDRGLEYLLEMWPNIRKEIPDATIDIAYGWNLYDKSPHSKSEEGKAWKEKIESLLNQEGITHHGRLPSDEVAKLYRQAEVWAYPTDFPEIDCITATKAMAAGCVPITTDFAVMKERNQGILVFGDIKTDEVKEAFQNELIKLLKDDKKKSEIRSKIDVSSFTWDNTAKAWAELF